MSESMESALRSVISDPEETSVVETIPGIESTNSNEIIDKTSTRTEPLYFTEKTTRPQNVSTLADPLREGVGEFSPDNVRKINRAITRKIPEAEKKTIIHERNQLVQKQFKVGLSTKEETRLKYVRWQLDRIDDAESGEFLDYLEKFTEGHEKFAKELKGFLGQLPKIQTSPKRHKKSSR
jgi:hypothetical protein